MYKRQAHNGIKNKLRAVGIANSELGALANADDGTLATYRIRAPISGVVARRAATLGATISAGDQGSEPMFTIVDDSVLWADIAIYKQDVEIVQAGDPVRLLSVGGKLVGEGQIATVLPLVDETSRTVTARMIVDNGDRKLRPGQFVSAEIETRVAREQLFIPSRAIVQVEGRPAVFVPSGDGFEPRPVRFEAGTDARRTAILSGLAEGEAYVAQGAFTLKAQLEKDAFGDGHAH